MGKKAGANENTAKIVSGLAMDEKSRQNLSRARRTVKDLILCNKFDYFCTFTFNSGKVDRYDFGACKKKITEVFKNYKSRYSSEFRYLIIPEFHKDGAVHFHGMVRGIREGDFTVPELIQKRDKRTDQVLFVPNTKKYADWSYYSSKLGFFSCSAIKNYMACACYVSKYITKDLMKLPLGRRVFMASENLSRPDLLFDEDGEWIRERPDFRNEFVSILDSVDHYGLLDEYWDEYCSDLRHPEEYELYSEELNEKDIFFPRLTGRQLKLGDYRTGALGNVELILERIGGM